jgi:hypothetical protein
MQGERVSRWLLLVSAAAILLLPTDASAQKGGGDSPALAPVVPLAAKVISKTKADGRSAISVTPSDGPEAHPDELASHPLLPAIDCPDATVIAASKQFGPSFIPVARPKAYSISCVLRYRGSTAPFQLRVLPPAPGLYGELGNPQPRVGDSSLVIHPFAIGKGGKSSRPKKMRAGVSAGSIVVANNKSLDYSLPTSAAPRALAIVFTDGKDASALFMPFIGKTELPVKARPKTTVQVRISGNWFGPVEMKARRATLDIEVPPGVRNAVVQAVGTRGNVTETFADLKTPELSRIASVASMDEVEAGGSVTIYVAVASPRGGAARPGTQLSAEAEGGTLSAAVSQGPGLWKLQYKAPTSVGTANVRISVAGDSDAGEVLVPVRVKAAPAGKFDFEIAAREYQPGESIEGTVTVADSFGNPVPAGAVKITLAGQPVAVTASEAGIAIKATIPNQLPADRKLDLVAEFGGASSSHTIKTVAGPSVLAKMTASIDERTARLRIVAADRFGNSTTSKGLRLVADAASASALVDEGDSATAVLRAKTGVRTTVVRVLYEDKELATKTITFGPPASAILVGAYAYGAWSSNRGELSVPRAGLGIGTRRRFGPIEGALLVGLEAFSSEDTVVADVAGMEQRLVRQLRGLAIPVMLRGRMRISREIGVAVSFGLTPTATSARLAQDKSASAFNTWTNGGRGEVSGDYKLGQGRIVLGTSYGRTKLSEGPIVGDIDGLRVYAGYEVWPLVFGP